MAKIWTPQRACVTQGHHFNHFAGCHRNAWSGLYSGSAGADGAISPSGLTSWLRQIPCRAGRCGHSHWLHEGLNAGPIQLINGWWGPAPLSYHASSRAVVRSALRRVHETPDATCCYSSAHRGSLPHFSAVPACHGRQSTLAWCDTRPSKTHISSMMKVTLRRSSSCCQGAGRRGT
jgi:hypothetical protein